MCCHCLGCLWLTSKARPWTLRGRSLCQAFKQHQRAYNAAAGTIAAGQSANLVLTYDITENTFQTVLQAAVLITTSGRPAAKVPPSHAL